MVDNTIKDHDGNTTDVYADYIQLYVQEYINTVLNDIDDIKRKQCFAGMIKYVAKKIAPMVNTDDLVMLDNLWDIYTGLCYRYNHVITIERYCILIGIARDTFYSWYKGEYRNDYCPELGLTPVSYTHLTCTMEGQMCFLLVQSQGDPCKGCNADRNECRGRSRE